MEIFSFSSERIEKLRLLNTELEKQEKRIKIFAKELAAKLKALKKATEIDDYNFIEEMSVFSGDEQCNKRNNVEFGDPLWKGDSMVFHDDDTIVNWNTLPKDHPLYKEVYCRSMHCLLFHSHLSWQDILNIDWVWFDLKVDYQFFF